MPSTRYRRTAFLAEQHALEEVEKQLHGLGMGAAMRDLSAHKEKAGEVPGWTTSGAPVFESWSRRDPESTQHGNQMKVLFIGENERSCWYLVRHVEELGCRCWFASTLAEIRTLLARYAFPIVLSTRPVTEGSPLMELLGGPGRTVFYSFPVEDGCLWFQAIPEVPCVPHDSAYRPGEFTSILDRLCSALGAQGA